jgi:hypothetical protein
MKSKAVLLLGVIMVTLLTLSACGGSSTDKTAGGVTVKNVTFAQSLNENYQPVNPTTKFKPTDTVYVSIDIAGRPKTGILNAKFYIGDQFIAEGNLDFSSVNQGVLFSVGEDTFGGFWLTPSHPLPVGNTYTLQVFINGEKLGDYPFEVVQ